MDHLRSLIKYSIDLDKFVRLLPGKCDDVLLKLYLGDDMSGSKVLHERGKYIDILIQQQVRWVTISQICSTHMHFEN